MSWVRVDDGFTEHPKLAALESDPVGWAKAIALWLAGNCYANRNRTDGEIATARVSRLVPFRNAVKVARKLVAAGLWDETLTGFSVHDFLHYNKSKAEREEATRRKTHRQKSWRRNHLGNYVDGNVDATVDGHVDASTCQSVDATVDAAPRPRPRPRPIDQDQKQVATSAEELALVAPGEPESDFCRYVAGVWDDVRRASPERRKSFETAQRDAHPGVDLLAVAKRLYAWEIANPLKAKSRHFAFMANNFGRPQLATGPPRPTEDRPDYLNRKWDRDKKDMVKRE